MSRKIPEDLRQKMLALVWSRADELGWANLPDADKAAWYENWAKDAKIGGVLGHFMDPRLVRAYIKDSMMKVYRRTRMRERQPLAFAALRIRGDALVRRSYEKPHGRMLMDGRVVCWGNSRDWKAVLFAVYERAFVEVTAKAEAAVLLEDGKTADDGLKVMVRDAGARLGISRVVWVGQ